MTAVATLLVIAFFAYLVHHYAPKHPGEIFHLHWFRSPGPLTDWSPSYYENQRQYSDLAAIYGRDDVPDPDAAALARPERTARRPISNPSCGAVEPTIGGLQASF